MARQKRIQSLDRGNCFFGESSKGGVAGQYSQVELFNPAASGKILIVRGVSMASAEASGFLCSVGRANSDKGLTPVTGAANMNTGGAAPVGQIRETNNATLLMDDRAETGVIGLTLPLLEINIDEDNPIILHPDEGFNAHARQTDKAIYVCFKWEEVNE